jgi:LuxR family transcriptional regulator, maltose regulon positive regulatory protein
MFLIESTDARTASAELIAEKIAVPAALSYVSRPRLAALLEGSLRSCTSTILSGRAGTGKTALALDFARGCGRKVAWYKVDAPEAQLETFFQYLTASIRRQRPNFGTTFLNLVRAMPTLDGISLLAEAFVYELAESGGDPLLIVIEDLHLVCDSAWLVPFFKRLMPLLPADVHLLITSRTMPPAPLWRMRSKQTLFVIDEDTLAFTTQEATLLFKNYGLSAEHASIALDHTHGRASSLTRFAIKLSQVAV